MNRQLLKVYNSLKTNDVESYQNTNNPCKAPHNSQKNVRVLSTLD